MCITTHTIHASAANSTLANASIVVAARLLRLQSFSDILLWHIFFSTLKMSILNSRDRNLLKDPDIPDDLSRSLVAIHRYKSVLPLKINEHKLESRHLESHHIQF
jgi:hypothetical protein